MQIYKITNKINNKNYIGKDTKNRKNYFGSGIIIKQAIKKYGKENFTKEILFECDNHDLLKEKEKEFIIIYDTKYPNGYNITSGGDGGDVISNHPNKEKIINKRTKILKETWAKSSNRKTILSQRMRGNTINIGRPPWNKKQKIKKICDECKKEFYTIRNTAKYCSNDCRYKNTPFKIAWNKGLTKYSDNRIKSIPCSEEKKKKISNSLKGHSITYETRLKISNSKKGMISIFKGKKHSEETKLLISKKTKLGLLNKKENI